MDRTDIEVVTEYERLTTQIRHPLVQQIVQLRIDVRTIVGALRRRRNGDGLPVGVGRLVPTIQRRWSEPQFGLERQFPWIETFFEKMVAGEAVEAERVLYEFTWTTWCRMATQFTFSFEAVLLYLARWSIVERWTSRDVESGRARFEKMIEETLGEYAFLQF